MSRRYRIAYQIAIQNPECKRQFGSYRYNEIIILKWIINKKDGKV
jgi:dTDP-D-glucose 4,6-dehydratase